MNSYQVISLAGTAGGEKGRQKGKKRKKKSSRIYTLVTIFFHPESLGDSQGGGGKENGAAGKWRNSSLGV